MEIVIIIAVLIVLILVALYWNTYMGERPKTLYDRLGGVFVIADIIDHFSDALIINPVVGKTSKNPYLNDWSNNKAPTRLAGLKFMRTLWLCAVSGGPFVYSPTRPGKCPFSVEKAHAGLYIDGDEFDAVAAELANTLNTFKVQKKEAHEVLSAFAAHKTEIVTGVAVC